MVRLAPGAISNGAHERILIQQKGGSGASVDVARQRLRHWPIDMPRARHELLSPTYRPTDQHNWQRYNIALDEKALVYALACLEA